MKELKCKCGDVAEWREHTVTKWVVDEEGNRCDKLEEATTFSCKICGKIIEGDQLCA